MSNDEDVDEDDLIVNSVTQPDNGDVINNGDDVSYSPDTLFTGIDVFTYVASDGTLTDTATVTVTVIAETELLDTYLPLILKNLSQSAPTVPEDETGFVLPFKALTNTPIRLLSFLIPYGVISIGWIYRKK